MEEIKLKTGPNEVIYPAILHLSRSDSRKLNQSDCIIRFLIPSKAHWYSPSSGLSVGIDNISLGNKLNNSCDNFIEISGFKSKPIKWCEDKKNDIGVSFRGSDYIDIQFHAGVDSNSSFEIIITPFEGKQNINLKYNLLNNLFPLQRLLFLNGVHRIKK